MTARSIRRLIRARPFRPFVALLQDGRRIPVTNPEWVLLSERGGKAAVFQKDDSLSIFNTKMVKELSVSHARRVERARSA